MCIRDSSYHDDQKGKVRGDNTIHRILTPDMSLCHLGDLGHLLSGDQISEIGEVDVLMIPVGGTYTIDASAACEVINEISPKIVIPMHYQTPHCILPIAPLDEFLELIDGLYPIEFLDTNQVEITPATGRKVIVLSYDQ